MKAFDNRSKGGPLNIFADEYNAFLAGVRSDKENSTSFLPPKSNTNTHNSVMFVKNISDRTVKQYECMVVEDFIFNPVNTNQVRADIAFKAQTSFKVNVYDETNEKHRDARIVILQEPIAKNKVGLAMVAGSSQIRVNILDQGHCYFTLISGKTILDSSTGGEIGSVFKQAKDGEGWAFGYINGYETKKQFKVIGLQENDVVHCHEYKNAVEGELVYKIALPYLNRRTPFDNKVDPNDPNFRYVYSDFNKRKAFLTVDGGEEEEDQILTPDYKTGQIIYATRGVVGGTDVKDESDNPIEWLEDNKDPRWWYEDEDAE